VAQNLHVAFHQHLWHRETDIKNYAPRHFCILSRAGICIVMLMHTSTCLLSVTLCIS